MNEELKSIKELFKTISSSADKVFIIGHDNPDLDSLASAIGLQTLCKALGKEAYIILDEPAETIEPVVKRVRDDNCYTYNIIDMSTFHQLKDDDMTLIVTDTNKEELVAVKDELADFKSIIIIDHHTPCSSTIKNASCYIPLITEKNGKQIVKVSSASEIVAQLLLLGKIDCTKDVYTYLYGGIYMDTNRFDKNVGEKTHETTHRVCVKGADTFAMRELLLAANYEEDKLINDLVYNKTIFKTYQFDLFNNYTIAFALNREEPDHIYRREMLAKAADKLLTYSVDAVFSMGYIDEHNLFVSARSKGKINVEKVMEYIGGGGNLQSAGAKLPGLTPATIEDVLSIALDKGITIEDNIQSTTETSSISRAHTYVKKIN